MKKKLLSLLLVLAMCLMLLPVAAFATIDDVEYYGLYINGVEVTSENKDDLTVIPGVTGDIKYDPEENALYLKNAAIARPEYEVDRVEGEATRRIGFPSVIYYVPSYDVIIRGVDEFGPEPLTIVSEGTNTINAGEYGYYFAAVCAPKVIFDLKAGSTLTCSGGEETPFSFGVCTLDYFIMQTPRGSAEPEGDLGEIVDLVVQGPGTLNAIGSDAFVSSAGIMCEAAVIDGAKVDAQGGEIFMLRNREPASYIYEMIEGCSFGIFSTNLTAIVGGADVAATADDAGIASIGLCSFYDIYIEDSRVDAQSGYYADEMCCGIYASESLTVTGGSAYVAAEGPEFAIFVGETEPEIASPLSITEPEGGFFDSIYEGGGYVVIDPGKIIAQPTPTEPPEGDIPSPQPTGEPIEYESPFATYVVISAEEIELGYWVKIAETEHGSVTSDVPCAGEGMEVVLTATPDKDASLYEIVALDDAGRPVALTEAGDGVYTLVMPASDVRVRARFIKDLPFEDVDPDDYYYDAVEYLYDNKIALGTSDTTFDPDGICTRAETVTFLWRTLGEPEPTATECKFTDVDPEAYYYKAVLWAAENGVTLGTSETTFEPDLKVQRCMTEAFLYRTIQLQGGGFTGDWAFLLDAPDAEDVPEWAYESTCWMVMNQIVQGDDAGNLLPLSDCTRGQIAAMIYRTVV